MLEVFVPFKVFVFQHWQMRMHIEFMQSSKNQ